MSRESIIWYSVIFLLIPKLDLCAQGKPNFQNLSPKRFIDKVEFVVGPSLCFNYGNRFIDNYKDANTQNKRLLNTGYCIGLGIYHPVRKWLDVNVRLMVEQKGTNSELTTRPADPGAGNLVQTITYKYTYNYLTLSFW